MTDHGAVWVGFFDMDDTRPVVGVSDFECADYLQARVLVRMHGAPLGHVSVTPLPLETLTARCERRRKLRWLMLCGGMLVGTNPRVNWISLRMGGAGGVPLLFPQSL